MSKHTPGPWVADKAYDPQTGSTTRAVYSMPTSNHIIEVVEAKGDEEVIARDADATLIAAAPEMLELLEDIATDIRRGLGKEIVEDHFSDIVDIISKAKGETE